MGKNKNKKRVENQQNKETKANPLGELFTISQRGTGRTPFETFTIGKETFQKLKEIAERELGVSLSKKVNVVQYFVLKTNPSLAKELKENWNK